MDTGDESGTVDVEIMIEAGCKNERQAISLLAIANDCFTSEADRQDDYAGLRDDQLVRLQQNLLNRLDDNEAAEKAELHQLNLKQVRDAVEVLSLQLQRMEKQAAA